MNEQSGSSNNAGVQRPEDENLGFAANLMYGLQHVLTMYGGIVAVPLIVAEAAGMSAADAGLLVRVCRILCKRTIHRRRKPAYP
nr:solute carrier family 23 protein [Comamonas fluminis]